MATLAPHNDTVADDQTKLLSAAQTNSFASAEVSSLSLETAPPSASTPHAVTVPSGRRTLAGIGLVVGIACSWVFATQFSQTVEASLSAPLFMVWFSALFNVLLASPALLRFAYVHSRFNRSAAAPLSSSAGDDGSAHSPLRSLRLSGWRLLLALAVLYCAWLVANYAYIRALSFTSVALLTSAFSSASTFVYLFSLVLLPTTTRLSALPILAVVVTASAVVCLASPWQHRDGDSSRFSSSLGGVVLGVVSAIAAALYKVSFKRMFGDPDPLSVGVLLALLGVVNLVAGGVLVAIFLSAGVERIVSGTPWGHLVVSALLGLVYNFLVNFGVAFTNPLFVSIGAILGVPLSIVIDFAWHHLRPTLWQLLGACGICVGFSFLIAEEVLAVAARRKAAATAMKD